MQAPAAATLGLSRRFGDVEALRSVDLEIERGEVYGFLGPNGAGKSTLIRVMCTLLVPSSGSAEVLGFDVVGDRHDVRLRIGVALQDVALDPKQTGNELLRLQGSLYGLSRSEIDERVAEIRGLIDLGDALDRQISTYSGGMKRRLDLAAALVHNPEVLFLDEPTSGLDPISRLKVWNEIRRLNSDYGMTIFLTTQYLDEADELADRVGIIHQGSIVAEGTPEELKRTVGTDVVVVRLSKASDATPDDLDHLPGVLSVERAGDEVLVAALDGAAVVGPVAVSLSRRNVDVRDITLRTASLDDVFFDVTGARIESADLTDMPGEDRT
jgi:ABC-2 type transport system ATP-binding protein